MSPAPISPTRICPLIGFGISVRPLSQIGRGLKVRILIQCAIFRARFKIPPPFQRARYSFKSLSRRSFSSSRSRLYLVGSSIVFDGGAIGFFFFFFYTPPPRLFFFLFRALL